MFLRSKSVPDIRWEIIAESSPNSLDQIKWDVWYSQLTPRQKRYVLEEGGHPDDHNINERLASCN